MALLFMDSFDHYVTADILEKWTAINAATIVASAGRNSTSAYRGSSSNRQATKGLNTSSSTIIMGAAVKFGLVNQCCFNVGEATVTHVLLHLASDGSLQVWRANAGAGGYNSAPGTGTMVATSAAGLVSTAVYYHIQFKVVIHDTTGSTEVRLNGVTVASGSSLDTRNGGTGIGNIIYIGGQSDIDDVYVCDGTGSAPWNDFLGDCRVDSLYPTAEGTTIGWTPLSGTDNALMVDETAPDDDTTYNSASVINLTDTLVVQDAPVVGATIYGIQHNLSIKKSDAGVCSIAPVIRHSGVDNVGSTLTLGTTYSYGLQVSQVNPGTSAAWVESDFNAAEFGYKRIT